MSDSNRRKARKCKSCGHSFYLSAKAILEHYVTCKRAEAIGMKLAGGLTYGNPEREIR